MTGPTCQSDCNSRRDGLCAEYQEQAEPWQIYSGVLGPMFRGNRLLIIAVGLVLAIPSYGQEAKQQQSKPRAESASQLERIASAVEKLPSDATRDHGCDPGKDNRQSDLCAQWKAADAAAEVANWTLWTLFAGLIGLVIGGGTLFAAWRAAHWAKRAADHTETGANAAVAALDSNRPWLSSAPYIPINLKNSYFNDQPVRDSLAFIFQWKNWGGSPATKVSFAHWYQMVPANGIDPPFEDPIDFSEGGVLIGPGQQTGGGQFGLSQNEVDRFRARELIIMVATKVRYASVKPDSPFYETETQMKFRHGGGEMIGPNGERADQITAEIHSAVAT